MPAKQLAIHLQHGLQQLPLHSSLFKVCSFGYAVMLAALPLPSGRKVLQCAPNLLTDSTQCKTLTDVVRMPVPSKGKGLLSNTRMTTERLEITRVTAKASPGLAGHCRPHSIPGAYVVQARGGHT